MKTMSELSRRYSVYDIDAAVNEKSMLFSIILQKYKFGSRNEILIDGDRIKHVFPFNCYIKCHP